MIQASLRKLRDSPWLCPALTTLGVVLYGLQAWAYVFIQTSFVDEGGYLYIGELYLRGILRPFQDFGPIRQYAPLAYLIPGQIEQWFGSGLLTGRIFSALCGLIMLIALWLIARRFGGRWGAALIILAIALTPISVQIYSLALSQAIISCLLAWMFFFILGENRPLWQIMLGAFLSGIAVMTRQNMLPLVPVAVAYIFWQHGRKAGIWALVSSMLPILVIHIIYWPNILQMWATWLPANLAPFLKGFQLPPTAQTPVGLSDQSALLLSFVQGFRFHYFSMVGFIICLLLWPGVEQWKDQSQKRVAVSLAVLFLILLVLHAWGSIFSTNASSPCTFCFTPYISFFDITALILVVVTFASWRRKLSRIKQSLIIILCLTLAAGLGYATYDRFGPWLLGVKFPAFNRGWDPRSWIPFITPWDILANKFHLDYWNIRSPVASIGGLFVGGIILAGLWILYNSVRLRKRAASYSFGAFILLSFLGMGVWVSPLMGGTYRQDGLCHVNIPNNFQKIGATLMSIVPPGSVVYWDVTTTVPLLYSPGITIHPAQIYGMNSFRSGGDPINLEKNGLWNDQLAKLWQAEADYIVIEVNSNVGHPGGDLNTSLYQTFRTDPMDPCDQYSFLVIYKKIP